MRLMSLFVYGVLFVSMFGFVGAVATQDVTAEVSYYDKLTAACRNQPDKECCLASVKSMIAGNYEVVDPKKGCPDGFGQSTIRCVGAYKWCEPLATTKEDKPTTQVTTAGDATATVKPVKEDGLLDAKVKQGLLEAKARLDKLNSVIDSLEAKDYDVSGLRPISAKVRGQLNEAGSQTVATASFYLEQIKANLDYLQRAITAVENNKPVSELGVPRAALPVREQELAKVKELAVEKAKQINERLEKFGDKLDALKEARKKEFEEAKNALAAKEARLKELRKTAFGEMDDAEKKEFKSEIFGFLEHALNQRIKLALRLELEGASPELAKGFVDFAEAKKKEFPNATVEQKKAIVQEVNEKWNEFRQAVAKDLFSKKMEAGLLKAKELLDRMNSVIDKVEAKGYEVKDLRAISSKVQGQISEAASRSSSMVMASFYLQQIKGNLDYLKRAILAVVNHQSVSALGVPRAAPPVEAAAADEATVTVSSEVARVVAVTTEVE